MSEQNNFTENLLRMVAGELLFLAGLQASREMYGKGYFSLGIGEKATVDQTVMSMIGNHYNVITAEYLAAQKPAQPMGFVPTHQPEHKST